MANDIYSLMLEFIILAHTHSAMPLHSTIDFRNVDVTISSTRCNWWRQLLLATFWVSSIFDTAAVNTCMDQHCLIRIKCTSRTTLFTEAWTWTHVTPHLPNTNTAWRQERISYLNISCFFFYAWYEQYIAQRLLVWCRSYSTDNMLAVVGRLTANQLLVLRDLQLWMTYRGSSLKVVILFVNSTS